MLQRGFLLLPMIELSSELESNSQDAILKISRCDLESSNFLCRGSVGTAARARVIIADRDDSDGIPGVFRQSRQREGFGRFFFAQELLLDRQIGLNDIIDPSFYVGNFIRRGIPRETKVDPRFPRFNVGSYATPAVEHPYHCLIEDMFRRMHSRIVFFLVWIEFVHSWVPAESKDRQ
jgi:hypothetical protein